MTINEKIYAFLCVLFSVIMVTGNLISRKFVSFDLFSFYTFEVSAGALLYPLTFLITDIIAEFFGREKSTFCVRLAISVNIFISLIIMVIDKLDATSWSKLTSEQFSYVFGYYNVGFIGSIIAFYTSQSVDIRLYLLIKKMTKDKMIWLRNLGSTSVALLIDTSIVITILTVFGDFPKDSMFTLIINSYIYKLFFAICNVPIFYCYCYAIKLLQKRESKIKEVDII